MDPKDSETQTKRSGVGTDFVYVSVILLLLGLLVWLSMKQDVVFESSYEVIRVDLKNPSTESV